MPPTVVTWLSRIPRRVRLGLAVTLTLAAITALAIAATTGHRSGTPGRTATQAPAATEPVASSPPPVPVPAIDAATLTALPEASTWTTLPAPGDTDRQAGTDGTVVHPAEPIPVFDKPGGAAFARLPVQQVSSDTWLPVIAEQPGWVRVLLPSRPNGATGWLDASRVQMAHTSYEIRVRLIARTIELYRNGQPAGTWPVGIGAAGTPTPAGRTFLLAFLHDPQQTYSPLILPLGTHSEALHIFGGGPGTVAIHTWPTEDVIGTPTSHGCIRIPDPAMQALRPVPLGTIVTIT